MKKILLVCLTMLLVTSCADKTDNSPLAVDTRAITTVFEEVNTALSTKDGTLLYDHLDQASIDYYTTLLTDVKAKSMKGTLVSKMNIATGLLLLTDEDLKTTDTKKFIEVMFLNSAVDKDKKDVLAEAALTNIKIEGDEATAMIFNTQPVKFAREDGQWKYNLLALQQTTENMLESVKEENEMTDKELLIALLSTSDFTQNPNIKRDFTEVFNLIQ